MIHDPSFTPPLSIYCGRCDLPAERLIVPRQISPFHWEFQAHCCGATRGARLSTEEVLRYSITGEKFWIIPKRGHGQTIKAQARIAPAPKGKIIVVGR